MRVGLVCPYSLTVPGGVQGQVVGLARSLRTLGHTVRVLAPCDGPPPDAGVTPLGKSLPTAANGSVAPIAPDVSCALRTIRALRDEDFDLVHLHEPLAPGPTLTSLLFADTAMVGTFHRSGPSPAYGALSPVLRRLGRRMAARCVVSDLARATAETAVDGPFEMLFNGIEIDAYAKATPHPADAPAILFVGRHEHRKGLAVLIDALPHLPSDAVLWVAGEGPDTGALRSATAGNERVEWLGPITQEQKASRLKGATVYCAPSLHGESFGVVLLEAMAAGTPIVASDLPGYRTVARPGTDALLVPPGDPVALGQALSRVLNDARLGERLASAGECRAAGFAMDRLAERYSELYAEALSAATAVGAAQDRRRRRPRR